ncbi:MAG: hypothetical protein HY077_00990 [Elusimicrobia bacterium]|nr:hypothetical protein [Elusimicrobiota bacterium]
MRNNTDLIAPSPVDWIKTYSLSPYSEHWSLTLAVKNFESDLPKGMKILEAAKATLTMPAGQSVGSVSDKSQQLSYRLSENSAKDVLIKLKKLDPRVQPKIMHNGELVNLGEVGQKLDKLTVERNGHRGELQSMPSIATMADEMIQHLTMVKQVREKVETQVLLNMTIRQVR